MGWQTNGNQGNGILISSADNVIGRKLLPAASSSDPLPVEHSNIVI